MTDSSRPLDSLASPGAGRGARAPLRLGLLRRILHRLSAGRLVVHLPDGEVLDHTGPQPGPHAVLMLHRWRPLRRLLLEGDIGLAESYMEGDWSTPDLATLIELGALNQSAAGASLDAVAPVRWLNRLRHLARDNSLRGSRRNIPAHYDLGNSFYAMWLDAGMSYSSALYATPEQSLEDAQTAKQDRILEMLALEGGEQVLEIGCGWGGLMERIAERGCHVTGLSLSPAQLDYARQRLQAAGLAGRSEARLEDYRQTEGRFDRIVSIEMLEAVGAPYWPTYFERVRSLLKPGGIAVLQVISIAEDRFATYQRNADFIQRHIFPGGMLPSISIMREQVGKAGLLLADMEHFGRSYAATLAEWHRRFRRAWPELRGMGFDERFGRKWEYYLAYCEAGFRAGAIDVGLYRIEKPA